MKDRKGYDISNSMKKIYCRIVMAAPLCVDILVIFVEYD